MKSLQCYSPAGSRRTGGRCVWKEVDFTALLHIRSTESPFSLTFSCSTAYHCATKGRSSLLRHPTPLQKEYLMFITLSLCTQVFLWCLVRGATESVLCCKGLHFGTRICTSLSICIWSNADICIFPTRYCLNLSYGTRSGGSWFHRRSHQAPASGPTGAQSPYCQWVQETQVSTTKAQTQVTG